MGSSSSGKIMVTLIMGSPRVSNKLCAITFSGTRKPMEAGTKAKGALEHAALQAYRSEYERFHADTTTPTAH